MEELKTAACYIRVSTDDQTEYSPDSQLKLLRENGHTIIFISHKLNEVKALCSRMTILRDGRTMGTYDIADLDEQEISRLMVGRNVSLDIEKEEADYGKNIFSVKDLVYVDYFGKTRLDHVSFSIRQGQILGVAGIDGNGQSELVEAIVGTLRQQHGTITLKGQDISHASVRARQEAGISHVSEDRLKYGSAPKLSLEDNTISKVYYTRQLKSHGLIDKKKVSAFTNRILKEFLMHKGQLLTYEILLDRLWDGGNQFVDKHALAVNMNRLRGKIEDEEHKYISNVYGMGYQWIGK